MTRPARQTRRPPRPRAADRASARDTGAGAAPDLPQPGVLVLLGVVGWQAVEPAIVAALATEAPVLLIGPHGTAKSLLLNRLAQALGLRHRHYNASLLNFDDLAYPVPSEDRARLVYVPTAGSIWDAESVFFDEISRCRIDLQNKLFPIIHERVVQGLPLPALRFRWAAMNPPAPPGGGDGEGDEDDSAADIYRGSDPLDPALADRFPFVVTVPDFGSMSATERRAVIAGLAAEPSADAASSLRAAVETTKRCLPAVREQLCGTACDYVAALLPLLDRMRRGVSPRRAHQLHDAVIAVHAARVCASLDADPGESAFLALGCGLPHPAAGRAIDGALLLAAHRQAWSLARLPAADPRRIVLSEPDPVRRVALGLRLGVAAGDLSVLVLDAHAGLPAERQLAFAAAFFPVASARVELSAAAAEALAGAQAQIEDPRERNHDLVPGTGRFELWRSVTHTLAGLRRGTRADRTPPWPRPPAPGARGRPPGCIGCARREATGAPPSGACAALPPGGLDPSSRWPSGRGRTRASRRGAPWPSDAGRRQWAASSCAFL